MVWPSFGSEILDGTVLANIQYLQSVLLQVWLGFECVSPHVRADVDETGRALGPRYFRDLTRIRRECTLTSAS